MKSISREIKLNVDAMNTTPNSPFAVVYKDEQFFFKGRRHNVPSLLRLGFLCCHHHSPEDQELELWHILNPKLEETVSKSSVEQFLKDLTYIALEMNLSKRFSITVADLLKHADENDTEEKKKAIDYIENTIKERDAFISKTMTLFADSVAKE